MAAPHKSKRRGSRRARAKLRRIVASLLPEKTRAVVITPTPPPIAVEIDPPADSLRSMELDSVIPPPPASRPPRSRAMRALPKRITSFAVLAGFVLVLCAFALRSVVVTDVIGGERWKAIAELIHKYTPIRAPKVEEQPAAEPPPRADAHLNRTLKGNIPGGVVFFPSTFSSADGTYDLFLHFHGNTGVVLESAEYAGLNAVVAIVNLGINSAPYLDAYAVPGTYEQLLEDINRVVGQRGLEHPHMRRLAISSWSGGYGAISMILEQRKGTDHLDSIVVLDGIHCGYLDDDTPPNKPKPLNTRILIPFLGAAKRAAAGELFFTITHSEVEPPTYAGTELTAGYLLNEVHGVKEPPLSTPEHVALKAAEGAVSKKLEKFMEPKYDARVGLFHVRGFKGNTPEHHMAHLLQMAATVMPEIAKRWKTQPSE